MNALTAYLVLGAAAGVLAGLFGLGGGIVIVPALFFLYLQQSFPADLCMDLAVGSSLVALAPRPDPHRDLPGTGGM